MSYKFIKLSVHSTLL